MQDPFPGWMDNLNGAAGVAVGAGKGILHSFYGNLKSKGDLVPVDIVCNSLIAMPWAEIDKKKSLVLFFIFTPTFRIYLLQRLPCDYCS